MARVNQCPLCDRPLDVSSEHIIPQAIGGKKGVTGFICNACNNDTGSKWDSQVVKRLEVISNLLRYKRQDRKAPRPAEVYSEELQTDITWDGNGGYHVPIRVEPIVRDGETTGMNFSGSNENRIKKFIKNALEKHDKKSQTPEGILAGAERRTIVNPTIRASLDFNLTLPLEKSATKSAMALAFSAGIAPDDCDIGLTHLKSGTMSNHITSVGDDTLRRIVNTAYNATTGKTKDWSMKHSVHLVSAGNLLTGYVEYAGLWRIVTVLSETFQNDFIFAGYEVDPTRSVDDYYVANLSDLFAWRK